MAKWGEGDPRWIVEERADSHNVNNWHWKEVGKLTRFLSIAGRTNTLQMRINGPKRS